MAPKKKRWVGTDASFGDEYKARTLAVKHIEDFLDACIQDGFSDAAMDMLEDEIKKVPLVDRTAAALDYVRMWEVYNRYWLETKK